MLIFKDTRLLPFSRTKFIYEHKKGLFPQHKIFIRIVLGKGPKSPTLLPLLLRMKGKGSCPLEYFITISLCLHSSHSPPFSSSKKNFASVCLISNKNQVNFLLSPCDVIFINYGESTRANRPPTERASPECPPTFSI